MARAFAQILLLLTVSSLSIEIVVTSDATTNNKNSLDIFPLPHLLETHPKETQALNQQDPSSDKERIIMYGLSLFQNKLNRYPNYI